MRWMCSQRTRSADIGFDGELGFLGAAGEQRRGHVVGIGGLREIVHRAHLHRRDGGRDVAVAGQHDGARLGALALQRRHHVEPVAVAEPQVDHSEGRRAPC